MIRSQEFTLAPGAAVNIDALTGYLRYANASAGGASTRIRVRAERGGAEFVMLPGEWCRFTEPQGRFYVSNADGQGTIIGTLIVGSGDYGSDRVAGSVEVIDGGRARTLAGVSFLGVVAVAPAAGEFAHVQLWNPPGSSRRLMVQKIVAVVSASATVHLVPSTTQLAALHGDVVNKRIGAGPGVAQRRAQTAAAQLGGLAAFEVPVAPASPFSYSFTEPVVLHAGEGLIVRAGPVGTIVTGNFEFFEEPV